MYDSETQQQFVELRVQGRSYARIAEELKVSKRTLIEWGRKFQFEIHNARVVEREALRERYLSTTEEYVRRLGEQLQRVEAELAKRDMAELSTMRLFGLDPPELHPLQNENRCRNGAETVQFSPRKQAKLKALHAELNLWMEVGRTAFDRHQHLRPRRRLPLGTVARLVNIATRFGRLASGMEYWPRRRKLPEPEDFSPWSIAPEEALERVYAGDPECALC